MLWWKRICSWFSSANHRVKIPDRKILVEGAATRVLARTSDSLTVDPKESPKLPVILINSIYTVNLEIPKNPTQRPWNQRLLNIRITRVYLDTALFCHKQTRNLCLQLEPQPKKIAPRMIVQAAARIPAAMLTDGLDYACSLRFGMDHCVWPKHFLPNSFDFSKIKVDPQCLVINWKCLGLLPLKCNLVANGSRLDLIVDSQSLTYPLIGNDFRTHVRCSMNWKFSKSPRLCHLEMLWWLPILRCGRLPLWVWNLDPKRI